MTLLDQANSRTSEPPPRIRRELSTVKAMISIYCRAHHSPTSSLCPNCVNLEQYASKRLTNCVYQEDKPTCGKCPIHCYKPSMRQEIIKVMRYSGPRMILHHPYLAVRHIMDGKRTVKHLSKTTCKNSLKGGGSEP